MTNEAMTVASALDDACTHISQLVELLDVKGLCQDSEALKAAREFGERLLKFARGRRCCHNCAHCRPDEGALHVGKTRDPLACFGNPEFPEGVYIPVADLGLVGTTCQQFAGICGTEVE